MSQSNGGREKDTEIRSGGVSFVMTVWLEAGGVEAEPEWRWRVTHVQTGKQSYFRRLNDVMNFIAGESGVPSPQ